MAETPFAEPPASRRPPARQSVAKVHSASGPASGIPAVGIPAVGNIERFIRSTTLRRRLWFAVASLASHGLVVGVALYLIDWLVPGYNTSARWAGLTWMALVLGWHLFHRGLSLHAADGTLGLQDRLVTWWYARDRQPGPVTDWLTSDLSRSIEALPRGRRGQLWRRPARRLLVVLPLLFVVWWIGPLGHRLFLASPYGFTEADPEGRAARGGGDQTAQAGDPQREKSGGGAANDPPPAGERDREPADRPPPERDPPELDPPERQPPERGAAPSLPPKPVLPLPGRDEFVIPDFIGEQDGKTRRAKVAVVEESTAEESAAGAGAGGDPGVPTGSLPEDRRRREFERAEERALRDRHVPTREREFVRRYFDELLRR